MNFNKFCNGYEQILHIIRIMHSIRLGKNSQISTNFIMNMNVRNNYDFLYVTPWTEMVYCAVICNSALKLLAR